MRCVTDYQHRIGRTGRAGESGLAVTYITNDDAAVLYDLRQYLLQSHQKVPPELDRHEAAQVKPGAAPDKPKRAETLYPH